jgi:ornithine cyclodeaminase
MTTPAPTARFFREGDVAKHLSMSATLDAVEASFRRLAAGVVRQQPRTQLHHADGYFAAMCVADGGLGLATVKSYTVVDGVLDGFVVTVNSLRDGRAQAVIEADLLTKLRTGAGSGVAAATLARAGASSLGIIGCGRQAPFQLDAIRCALPGVSSVRAWTRRPDQLADFCARTGASPAASAQEAAGCDIVVAATTSSTPVIRGEWLRPGALVIAIGGDAHGDRELDDAVIERAALITCDSIASSRQEAADLWAPAESGLVAWDDVVELQAVVAGTHPGRTDAEEIILFKSNGMGAWDVAAAAALIAAAA